MRVLDVTEFYSMRGGGIRSHLEAKSHVLCQRDIPHRIVAPGPENRRQRLGSCGELELLRGPRVPYDPTYHALWRPDRVAASIREFAPDVVEVHSAYVAVAGALLATPGVVHGGRAAPYTRRQRPTHTPVPLRTLVWHSDHVGTYVEPWLAPRVGARAADVLTAPLWAAIAALTRQFAATFVASRTQLDRLREHGAVRVEVLPFGVDPRFHPRPRDPTARTHHVVAVGRMAVEKRWDLLLDAFAEAAQDRPEWRLLALGDGPERGALEARARRLLPPERVHFAGFLDRDTLAQTLASAEVFVHACPHETFGLAVAEALASGLLAVVPDRGGASEWAHEPRVRTFQSGNVHDAAAQLRAWIDLPASTRLPAPTVLGVTEHFTQLLERYRELRGARG